MAAPARVGRHQLSLVNGSWYDVDRRMMWVSVCAAPARWRRALTV